MTLDTEQLRRVLPHRYPFLLVDRIVELEPGVRAVGKKNVSVNEPFFAGHWPHRAVMPAVLILESMAQVGGVILLAMEEHRGENAYFVGVNKARFRKPVVPGDSMMITVKVTRIKSTFGTVDATVEVDGQEVASAELMFGLAPDGIDTKPGALDAKEGSE